MNTPVKPGLLMYTHVYSCKPSNVCRRRDFQLLSISKTKCGYKPRSKGLSYSRLRELVLEAFKDIVPDISAIGTHSLRSGGATAAANAGVPDRLFKRHGRWASESAKDGYVQDSLSSRLSVSKALGI